MGTYTFSHEEITQLKDNQYILTCSEKSVTYTYEFKKMAVEQYDQGIRSREIFKRVGIDLGAQKHTHHQECIKRWKKIVKKKGFEGLKEARGLNATGRPKARVLTDQDKIKQLELQVKYLKAENDFLAKLRAKRAESNSGQKTNTKSSNS